MFLSYQFVNQVQGVIYCLDKNFLDKAKEEIGDVSSNYGRALEEKNKLNTIKVEEKRSK